MGVFKLTTPKIDEKEFIIRCDCGWAEHQMGICWFSDEEPIEMYITFHLTHNARFFGRLWQAIQYVLGYRSRFGEMGELVLFEQDVVEIQKILDQYLADTGRYGSKGGETGT